jgi:hypothetical protein
MLPAGSRWTAQCVVAAYGPPNAAQKQTARPTPWSALLVAPDPNIASMSEFGERRREAVLPSPSGPTPSG